MSTQPNTQTTPKDVPREKNSEAEFWKGVFSIIVLGLTAAIIAQTGGGDLRNAAIGTLCVSVVSLFSSFRLLRGPWTGVARFGLVVMTLLWLATMVIMFLGAASVEYLDSSDDSYDKRSIDINLRPSRDVGSHLGVRSGPSELGMLGADISQNMDRISYVAAIFSLVNFLVCIIQWFYDLKLRKTHQWQVDAATSGIPMSSRV